MPMRSEKVIRRGEAYRRWDERTNVTGATKEELIDYLKTDQSRQDRAAIALSQMGEAALPELFDILKDESVELAARKLAFETIGAIYGFVELDYAGSGEAKLRRS